MALFGNDAPQSLEDVLGNQAKTAASGVQDQYAQARKRLVAKEAASGRLMGGVSDYPLADLAKEGAGAESDIYSSLASALGGVPAEDWANARQYGRNLSLAELIGSINKPSTLQEVLGGVRTAGGVASTFAGAMG